MPPGHPHFQERPRTEWACSLNWFSAVDVVPPNQPSGMTEEQHKNVCTYATAHSGTFAGPWSLAPFTSIKSEEVTGKGKKTSVCLFLKENFALRFQISRERDNILNSMIWSSQSSSARLLYPQKSPAFNSKNPVLFVSLLCSWTFVSQSFSSVLFGSSAPADLGDYINAH